MSASINLGESKSAPSMATAWRRRRMCILLADCPTPAALRSISGQGAFLETNARPPLQSEVQFHHPDAGAINARVQSFAGDGIHIAFAQDTRSVAFALAAIAADMTHG